MSTTNHLNGYDEVLAITIDTINSQFSLLCPANGSGPILNSWSAMDPNDPNNYEGIVVTNMTAPTVSVKQPDGTVNKDELAMTFYLVSGTLNYYDYGSQASIPIDNWTITFRVNIGALSITTSSDLNQISTSGAVNDQLNNTLSSNDFSITALFTDFEDANITSAVIEVTGDTELTTAQQSSFLAYLSQYLLNLQDSGTPYILGYPLQSNDPVATVPNIPTFAPISSVFSNTPDPYNYSAGDDDSLLGLSTLNYLIMTGSGKPTPPSSDNYFDFNWITDGQNQGVFAIEQSLFRTGYIENLILPVLTSSLGVPSSTSWSHTVGNDNSHNYVLNFNEYPYSDENGGKGHIVGQDWPDNIYEELHNQTYCEINVPAGAGDIVMNGSGYFYSKADLYEYPFTIKTHDGWASTKLSFTFTITLEAGTNGSIVPNFVFNAGEPVTDQWENFVYAIYDWFVGWFADTLTDMEDDMNDNFASFQTTASENLNSETSDALNSLANTIILPNGDIFFYKDIQFDDQQNVRMHVTYKED